MVLYCAICFEGIRADFVNETEREVMDKESLLKMIRRFPDKPGVYIMHGEDGKAIYIGKAKSLKKRVSSYFRHATFASPRLARLVSDIADISTIRTEN